MEVFKSKDFKRNSDLIKKKIKQKDNMLIANEDLYILVYGTFVEKNITILDNVCKVLGILAIVDEKGNYGIMNIPNTIKVEPNEIEDVEIDGEHYYKLAITGGEPLVSDLTVVKDTDYVYKVFEVLTLRGKVPFFIGYTDMLGIFSNLPKYTGASIGKDSLPFEFFTAMISRDIKDPTKNYRDGIKTKSDLSKEVKWIGVMNIYYSFGSTLAKIAGSYFKQGLLVSTVNKQEGEPTKLEKALRE